MMAVSDTPWHQFSQADYSPQQWARACLIDTDKGDKESKDRYKLPVREPNGSVNRNAVHAAAARLNQVDGISPEQRAVAAKKLSTLYRTDLGETPPDSLTNMEKQGERSAPPDIERLWTNSWFKTTGSPVEVRTAPDGKKVRTIGGYAAVFNRRSQPLGGFVEVVEPSFFNKSRANGYPDVVCRFNHNDNMLLGTTASGTLRLAQDETGLDYQVDMPECRQDVYEMVQRRDIRNSSFAFQVYDQDWDTSDGGYPVRHLLSGRLIDVAPVTVPAYPDATVGLRSLAQSVGAPLEDVVALSANDELRKLFIRTDKDGGAKSLQQKSGRQALMEIMSMRPNDPIAKGN